MNMSDDIEHPDNEDSAVDGSTAAQEERLIGRRAIQRLEQVGSGPPAVPSDRAFDLRVAAELEARGYTFEAEMRYRAALRVDQPTRQLTRLALLLEFKGVGGQALPLYISAAQAGEPDALF